MLSDIEDLRLNTSFDAVILGSFLIHAPAPGARAALLEVCRRHVKPYHVGGGRALNKSVSNVKRSLACGCAGAKVVEPSNSHSKMMANDGVENSASANAASIALLLIMH